ncbi:MAG: nucleotidyltransferase domain-containing protein [Nanoarchaeota archaeon]
MADKLKTLIDEIYQENTYPPQTKKTIYKDVDVFMSSLQAKLSEHGIDADVFLGGSSAKGTFLKGSFDCDIFVRFDYKKYAAFSHEISDILHKPLHELTAGNVERVHGSRDYFQYKPKNISPAIAFEFIPVLAVNDPMDAKNVTDVSPLHVRWIQKYLSPGLTKQIVVTKLFLKAQGLYGAESYIKGFSGHDVDILIAHYGSFETLLHEAVHWKKHTIIDVEGHYAQDSDVFHSLNASKIGPLILVDPVQPERNAAASLSLEKFNLFKEKALAFLARPSKSAFTQKPFSLTSLKRKRMNGCQKIIFKVVPKKGKPDVIGSKLLKAFTHIRKHLEKHDFEIFDADWYWDKQSVAYFWFFVTEESLLFMQEHPFLVRGGPPKENKIAVKAFKGKHKDVYEEHGRLFTRVKREFLSIDDVVDSIINDPYVLQRVESIAVIS